MSLRHIHTRLLLVAFMAIAGTVLGASDAAASPEGGRTGSGSCCARPMPDDCRCCPTAPAAAAAPSSKATPAAHASGHAHLNRSRESCSCRPADPARRDTRQESRSTEDRSSEPGEGLPLPTATRPRSASSSPPGVAARAERAALFLRTGRLLL